MQMKLFDRLTPYELGQFGSVLPDEGLTPIHRADLQRWKVMRQMLQEKWSTIPEIVVATGAPPQSVSARIRDFRKVPYGSHTVNKRLRAPGLWEYELILNREGR